MSQRYHFDVQFDIDGHTLRVTGFKQPEVPEVRATMGDPGSPAEGGELEDLEEWLLRRAPKGQRERRLPPGMLERLDLDEAIYEALEAA